MRRLAAQLQPSFRSPPVAAPVKAVNRKLSHTTARAPTGGESGSVACCEKFAIRGASRSAGWTGSATLLLRHLHAQQVISGTDCLGAPCEARRAASLRDSDRKRSHCGILMEVGFAVTGGATLK